MLQICTKCEQNLEKCIRKSGKIKAYRNKISFTDEKNVNNETAKMILRLTDGKECLNANKT